MVQGRQQHGHVHHDDGATVRGFRAEPVAVVGAVRAVIYMLMAFGLVAWTDLQIEAVLLVVTLAVIPFVEFLSGLFLRSKVTTDDTLEAAGTTRREAASAAKPDNDVQLRPVSRGRLLQDWERDQ